MKNIVLRNLNYDEEDLFLEANSAQWGEFSFAHYYEDLAQKDFKKYLKIIEEMPKGLHLPEGHVPCTFLFAFNDNGDLVGRTSIRHRLTDFLLKVGGHIGYGVVPKYRRQGYAFAILKESLNYIGTNLPDIKEVLLTCDEGNIGSEKTIEKNGGLLENIIEYNDRPNKKRYWIRVNQQNKS